MAQQPQQGKPIDLVSLPANEVVMIRRSVEEDIQYLEDSLRQLQVVVSKFGQSKSILKQLNGSQSEGAEVFVPLTSSLYVPGTLENSGKVLVDIGTGFYVEKTLQEAIDYKDKKAKYVMQNAQQIENLLDQKAKNLQQIDLVLQHKLEQQQARQRVK